MPVRIGIGLAVTVVALAIAVVVGYHALRLNLKVVTAIKARSRTD